MSDSYLAGYLAAHIARGEGLAELDAIVDHIEAAAPSGYTAVDDLHTAAAASLRATVSRMRADGTFDEVRP